MQLEIIGRGNSQILLKMLVEILYIRYQRTGINFTIIQRHAPIGTGTSQEAVFWILFAFQIQWKTFHCFFHRFGISIERERYVLCQNFLLNFFKIKLNGIFCNDNLNLISPACFPKYILFFFFLNAIGHYADFVGWKVAANNFHK